MATGPHTFLGGMAEAIGAQSVQTAFDKGVKRFTWLMIRFMAVMVPIVFLLNGVVKGDLKAAFLFSIAVAVGLTTEMLPMVVTTALAKGAVARTPDKRKACGTTSPTKPMAPATDTANASKPNNVNTFFPAAALTITVKPAPGTLALWDNRCVQHALVFDKLYPLGKAVKEVEPDLAAEVTFTAADKLGVDAAVTRAFRLTYQRAPDDDERRAARGFLQTQTRRYARSAKTAPDAETRALADFCRREGIPMERAWSALPSVQREQLLRGKAKGFLGVVRHLESLEPKKYKQYIRVFLRRYQSARECPTCHGAKLQADALNVKVGGKSIADVAAMPIDLLRAWIDALFLSGAEQEIAAHILREARDRGLPVYAETCPQYLYLSLENFDAPGFEGAKYVYTPPPRAKANQDVLWDAVRTDVLSAISTDHCAFRWDTQKSLGADDFSKIPNGGPGIENRLQMIHEFGVRAGEISLNRMVELLATNPRRAIEKAVKGMLPHNKLSDAQIGKLKVYAGATHPHAAQQPTVRALPKRAVATNA